MTDLPPDDAPTREEAREPSGSETLEELLFLCLERPEDEWPTAIEELCALHPGSATAIRKGFERLKELGLAEPEPQPRDYPESLGDFQLLRRLGGGGMGVVYLAEQRSLGRKVALKLIRPEHLYFPKTRQRFQREIEAIARLKHRGIVSIHTVGEHGDLPYFAMEWVNGCTLATLLQDLRAKPPAELDGWDVYRVVWAHAHERPRTSDPPPFFAGSYVQVIFRIAWLIAEALDYAHSRGVVHRDLKPSNVMLTIDGRALLLDFGLAALEGANPLTREGTQLGSLPYMAPERVLAQEREPSPRSDVYGLGVLLYQLLTLRLPYDAESSSEVQERILAAHPERPRTRNPAIPWEMETVCLTAMAREPQRRYATAGDLAEDCRAALELRPIRARRPGPWLAFRRWVQRHPTASAGIALLALGLTAGPLAYAFAQRAAALEQERLREDAERERERAERRAYLANIVAARASLEAGKPTIARERLEACPEERRRWEWHYLHARLDESTRTYDVCDHRIWHLDVHEASRRLACVSEEGSLHVLDLASGRVVFHAELGESMPTRCAWNAAGTRLAVGFADGRLTIFDDAWRETTPETGLGRVTITALAFHPLDERLAVGASDGSLTFLDLARDPPVVERLANRHRGRLNDLAYDRSGTRLVTAGYDGKVLAWNLDARPLVARELVSGTMWIEAIALDASGRRLAWLGIDARVRVHDLLRTAEDGTAAPQSPTVDTAAVDLAWSADGRSVLVAHGTSITALDGDSLQVVRRFVGHGDLVSCVHPFSTGDAFLSTGSDGTVKAWDSSEGRDRPRTLRMESSVGALVVLDDGRRVVAGDYRGNLVLWDGRAEVPLASWSDDEGQITALTEDARAGELIATRASGSVERRSTTDGRLLARGELADAPFSLALDAARDRLAVGTKGGLLLQLDLRTLQEIARTEAHEGLVACVQLHPSGSFLVSAGHDGRVRTWNAADLAARATWDGASPRVHRLAIERSGALLACGGTDGVVELLALDPRGALTLRATLRPANGAIQQLAFDDSGTRLFIATPRRREIEVWDVDAGQRLMALPGPGRTVLTFALSPDGSTVFAGDMSPALRAWPRDVGPR